MFIDPTRYSTAPPADGRQPKEMACYALLDRLGVEYIRLDHDPGRHHRGLPCGRPAVGA